MINNSIRLMFLCLFFSSFLVQAKEQYIEVNDIIIKRDLMSVFVLPNESLRVSFPVDDQLIIESGSIQFVENLDVSTSDETDKIKNFNQVFVAKTPEETGIYDVYVLGFLEEKQIHLQVVVMVPFKEIQNGFLEEYRIDEYPKVPFRGLKSYEHPAGFVRITEEMLNKKVSQHFTFQQFLCKQHSGYPKFIVVQTTMLQMLESFFDFVVYSGYEIESFGVISAYRTPFYNRMINNGRYSRHQYGDAMDLFIDENRDGRLDDLNNDQKITMADVDVLYNLAIEFQKSSEIYIGGIGKYRPKSIHGGFVHMDNRGYMARW